MAENAPPLTPPVGSSKPHSFWRQPYVWIGLGLYLITCLYVFRDFLFSGGMSVASLGGDSVKNTFSFLYQAVYGEGVWFGGMNYPFGEHLSFADGQPLVTLLLGALGRALHLSQPQLLYVMYWAIALSFIVGMVYTQRLLDHFGVHPAWAIVFSSLVLIMSPHIYRYTGHYPLSYASFLPMLFYWSVRYHETNRNSFLVKIFLLFFAYAFLHLYFLAMGLAWALPYAIGAWLFRRHKPGRPLGHGTRYLVATLGAYAAAQFIFYLTDPIKDRPALPLAGGYEHGGGLNLLTSKYSPIWQGAKDLNLLSHIHDTPEGFCYLGIMPLIMMLVFAVLGITGFARKINASQRRFEGQWFFITFTTLLFAVVIKYIWEEGIFGTLLTPLRQFRAPERFSWIAYYVLSIIAAVVLYRICHYWWLHQKKVLAGIIGFLGTAVWAIDANGAILYFHRAQISADWNAGYLFGREISWKRWLGEKGHQPKDFQAILALPYVHVGSEKIWLNEFTSYCITPAFKAALEMGLPVMDVYMSRTSWSQTFEATRLAGGLYAKSSSLGHLPDSRPLLLIQFNPDPLTPDEKELLQPGVADSLGSLEDCTLYAFWPQKFVALQMAKKHQMQTLAAALPVGDTVLGAVGLPCYTNHMEEGEKRYGIAGKGLAPIKGTQALLSTFLLPVELPANTVYELSGWSRFVAVSAASNYYQLRVFDEKGEQVLITDALGKYSTDNAADMWFRSSKYFEMPGGCRRLEVWVENPASEGYLAMDELLLRPAEATVISKMPNGQVLVNNHLLR